MGDGQDELDSNRLSRRAAMKAAVGGAAAAAVFIAPRVEGFSLVPDYASAATCSPGANLVAVLGAYGNGNTICWGNASGQNCVDEAYSLNAAGVTVTGNISGKPRGNNNVTPGALNIATVNGRTQNQTCNLVVRGACGAANNEAGNSGLVEFNTSTGRADFDPAATTVNSPGRNTGAANTSSIATNGSKPSVAFNCVENLGGALAAISDNNGGNAPDGQPTRLRLTLSCTCA